jgi:ParB/RepB/Spo0J family partition protein
MSKHILKDVDVIQKRTDMFYVDPGSIKVVEGWNDRADFTGEDELKESIKELGVRQPLRVRKTPEKTLELVDGERRLRCVMKARAEGSDIQTVPVIVLSSKVSEIELYLESVIANTGKPLEPLEEAASFKRLVNWGLQVSEIARKSGRSVSHIRNRLSLSDATPTVKEAVKNKDITTTDAVKIVKGSGGRVDPQNSALEEKKNEPKVPRRKISQEKELSKRVTKLEETITQFAETDPWSMNPPTVIEWQVMFRRVLSGDYDEI